MRKFEQITSEQELEEPETRLIIGLECIQKDTDHFKNCQK